MARRPRVGHNVVSISLILLGVPALFVVLPSCKQRVVSTSEVRDSLPGLDRNQEDYLRRYRRFRSKFSTNEVTGKVPEPPSGVKVCEVAGDGPLFLPGAAALAEGNPDFANGTFNITAEKPPEVIRKPYDPNDPFSFPDDGTGINWEAESITDSSPLVSESDEAYDAYCKFLKSESWQKNFVLDWLVSPDRKTYVYRFFPFLLDFSFKIDGQERPFQVKMGISSVVSSPATVRSMLAQVEEKIIQDGDAKVRLATTNRISYDNLGYYRTPAELGYFLDINLFNDKNQRASRERSREVMDAEFQIKDAIQSWQDMKAQYDAKVKERTEILTELGKRAEAERERQKLLEMVRYPIAADIYQAVDKCELLGPARSVCLPAIPALARLYEQAEEKGKTLLEMIEAHQAAALPAEAPINQTAAEAERGENKPLPQAETTTGDESGTDTQASPEGEAGPRTEGDTEGGETPKEEKDPLEQRRDEVNKAIADLEGEIKAKRKEVATVWADLKKTMYGQMFWSGDLAIEPPIFHVNGLEFNHKRTLEYGDVFVLKDDEGLLIGTGMGIWLGYGPNDPKTNRTVKIAPENLSNAEIFSYLDNIKVVGNVIQNANTPVLDRLLAIVQKLQEDRGQGRRRRGRPGNLSPETAADVPRIAITPIKVTRLNPSGVNVIGFKFPDLATECCSFGIEGNKSAHRSAESYSPFK